MTTNGKLVEELSKMQDLVRNLESMNVSNLNLSSGFPGGNNILGSRFT